MTQFFLNRLSWKTPSIALGVFSFLVVVSTQKWKNQQAEIPRVLIAPPQQLEHFSFGFRESMADVIWVRAIQDFDFCDKPISKKVCQNNSWLYRMIDQITTLSPDWRFPYSFGSLALSVLITDVDGAEKVLDKAIVRFPNDWILLYRAGYHAIYETHKKEKAAGYLIRAGKNGAPAWVYSLATRLYTDEGQLELAERLLADMVATKQDEKLIERVKEKILKKKAELAAKK